MRSVLAVFAAVALTAAASAQDKLPFGGPPDPLMLLSVEDGIELSVVKGQPYQAEAVTEIVQPLADGNRIKRRISSLVYRDAEGRTRRETSFAGLGPFAPAEGGGAKTVFIHDPVSGVGYVLEADTKTARKLSRMPHPEGAEGAPRERIFFRRPGPGGGGRTFQKRLPEPLIEPLGSQTLDGLELEGTRTKITIPAGEIGNEKPIEIVSQRWYSTELQAVVMSTHNDPRLGDSIYRLTNINRSEPDHTLFEVPADYTVKEGPPLPFHAHDKTPGV